MKIFFKHKLTPRLGLFALLLLLCSSRMYAQSTEPKYIDGMFTVAKGEIVEWYGDVEIAATAQLIIEDGAQIIFYGNTLKVNPGAQIIGTDAGWASFSPGIGTGKIVFQKPNPIDNSANQQVLDGGNSGTNTQNVFTSIEINNPKGVKLSGSNTRVGGRANDARGPSSIGRITFTAGHIFLETFDLIKGSAAHQTGADNTRYFVTNVPSSAGGHVVYDEIDPANDGLIPIGMAVNDYTPARIYQIGGGGMNSIHANVTNYAGDPPAETLADGMDRVWNIYGNFSTTVRIALQHNSATNQAQWNSNANFVTRYGTNPNNTGDVTSGSAWQSNTPGGSSPAGGPGTESNDHVFSSLASNANANEAWYSKASNTAHPLSQLGVVVNAKVFLQGAMSGATMTTKLNAPGIMPTVQPYNTAPFNYAGTEDVTATGIPAGVTDWVLVELRDKTTPTTVVATKAAFVKSDGSVVDLDGTSAVSFPTASAGNYHIAIRHRNHLAIRTANAQALSGVATLYDFTSGQAQAYQNTAITTNTAMKDLGNGVFAMWGGDGTSNGVVRYTGIGNDETFLASTTLSGVLSTVLSPVYSTADYNMNGVVRYTGIGNDETFLSSTVLAGVLSTVLSQHL